MHSDLSRLTAGRQLAPKQTCHPQRSFSRNFLGLQQTLFIFLQDALLKSISWPWPWQATCAQSWLSWSVLHGTCPFDQNSHVNKVNYRRRWWKFHSLVNTFCSVSVYVDASCYSLSICMHSHVSPLFFCSFIRESVQLCLSSCTALLFDHHGLCFIDVPQTMVVCDMCCCMHARVL
jgi:hypothetical protein